MAATVDIKQINKINALTERVIRLREKGKEGPIHISSQASHSFTTSWRETEGEPIDIRKAKAYMKNVKDSPVVIRDDELIVGSLTKYGRGSTPMTAIDPDKFLERLDKLSFKRLKSYVTPIAIDPEEEKILREDALYWDANLPHGEDFVSQEIRKEFGDEYFDMLPGKAFVFHGLPPQRAASALQPTAESPLNLRIVRDGFNSVITRIKAEQGKITHPSGQSPQVASQVAHKATLLSSTLMAVETVIEFAQKHGKLAREMASKESNPIRKKELQKIAEHCEWVPANPPRDFHEALQSVWFHMLAAGKNPSGDLSIPCLGRLDHYLYPYYEKDLKEGKITRQEAAELLGILFVKINEAEYVFQGFRLEETASGGSMLIHITLGGRTEEGRDATNELSYLILEVSRQLHYAEPAIYVRYHDGMKKDFMIKALEVNRELGGGTPAFLNDQLGTARYLARGVKIDDAVDWNAIGCTSCVIPHISNWGPGMTAEVNLPKILELILNNGVDPRTGLRVGLQTGDATKFTRIEQFYEAFEKQYSRIVDMTIKANFIEYGYRCAQGNNPFTNALIEDCITQGLGVVEGGGWRYPNYSTLSVASRGCTDVADSLTAIKKLVFEGKKYTIGEIVEALNANWGEGNPIPLAGGPPGMGGPDAGVTLKAGGPPPVVGTTTKSGKRFDSIYQDCLKAPKYGNDDDYADDIFNYISLKEQEIVLKKRDLFSGGKLKLQRIAGAAHVLFGQSTGALPNGRKAGLPLNDAALSPMGGSDINGPTAVIKSATKANHNWEEFCCVINMKFNRPLLNSPQKLEHILTLIKTYFDNGGWHIQLNIHSTEELIDAKVHPDKHQDLIVRVAGFCAYFVDLYPPTQDEIIARTMHSV